MRLSKKRTINLKTDEPVDGYTCCIIVQPSTDTVGKNGRQGYCYEASLPERWYLGCVLCSLTYHCVEGRAKASCIIIANPVFRFLKVVYFKVEKSNSDTPEPEAAL